MSHGSYGGFYSKSDKDLFEGGRQPLLTSSVTVQGHTLDIECHPGTEKVVNTIENIIASLANNQERTYLETSRGTKNFSQLQVLDRSINQYRNEVAAGRLGVRGRVVRVRQ